MSDDDMANDEPARGESYRGGELITRTGIRFHVRPAQPEDEAALAEFFTHVTPEDLRFRFLEGVHRVSHAQLVAMTTVDHSQTESFLVTPGDADMIIATAMLAADAKLECGEVAISIRSDFKQLGIGWTLLDYVARHAQARGMRQIESIEHRGNRAAILLEKEMGFTAQPVVDDPMLLLVRRTFF